MERTEQGAPTAVSAPESSSFVRRVVEDGDACFVWLGYKTNPARVILTADGVFKNHLGAFHHANMIGKPYGSKIFSTPSRYVKEKDGEKEKKKKTRRRPTTYVRILPFCPVLWTRSLKHRTQIIYDSDNSLILSGLDLRPGKIVAESGTGSTSLSHAIIRAVIPNGILHTFEFNKYRKELAEEDFRLNLKQKDVGCVKVFLRDVVAEGFHVDGTEHHRYDAIFLDLPEPWMAIAHAYKSLKQQGRICTFSPCIEQTQKVCMMLKHYGFYDIETIECVSREMQSVLVHYPTPNCLVDDDETANNVQEDQGIKDAPEISMGGASQAAGAKQVTAGLNPDSFPQRKKIKTGKTVFKIPGTRPFSDIAGHTGFLTFATK